MPVVPLGPSDYLIIITHVKRWVTNLLRAKKERKIKSKEALRAVILAVRMTTSYLSFIEKGGQEHFEKESELSLLWTKLFFKLVDLKLEKLATRCKIVGKKWANHGDFDEDFLKTAENRLSKIEEFAESILMELN